MRLRPGTGCLVMAINLAGLALLIGGAVALGLDLVAFEKGALAGCVGLLMVMVTPEALEQ